MHISWLFGELIQYGPGKPNDYCHSLPKFLPGSVYEFYFALSGKLVGKEESYCHVNITINLLCIEKVFY